MTPAQADAVVCFVERAFGDGTLVNWDGDPELRGARRVRLAVTANLIEGQYETRREDFAGGTKLRETTTEVHLMTITARLHVREQGAWAGAIADAAGVRMRRPELQRILEEEGIAFVSRIGGAQDFNFKVGTKRVFGGAAMQFRIRFHVVDDGKGTAGQDWIETVNSTDPEVET
jgi:hypothetical protein